MTDRHPIASFGPIAAATGSSYPADAPGLDAAALLRTRQAGTMAGKRPASPWYTTDFWPTQPTAAFLDAADAATTASDPAAATSAAPSSAPGQTTAHDTPQPTRPARSHTAVLRDDSTLRATPTAGSAAPPSPRDGPGTAAAAPDLFARGGFLPTMPSAAEIAAQDEAILAAQIAHMERELQRTAARRHTERLSSAAEAAAAKLAVAQTAAYQRGVEHGLRRSQLEHAAATTATVATVRRSAILLGAQLGMAIAGAALAIVLAVAD